MANIPPVSLRRTRIAPSALPDGAVLIDQTRERTSWEEGMFVTSAHFNRDQSYVIARQSDLAQAVGAGVVEGLEVSRPSDDPTAVIVAPGLGIGGGGESILVHAPVRISLADIALQKSLTQGAGLTGALNLIGESRTGLFVLCATPVEYGSNPIGSYATTASGQRTLRDSVVNEATLFTLVPFSLSSGAGTAEGRQAAAARRVFLDGAFPDIPNSSLPLAMMELDGNALVWLDMHLARRRAGAARSDAFGLGAVDTPARIAHYAQYDAALQAMTAAAPGQGFAAADRFDILPPMGRMPAACVAPRAPAPGLAPVLSHNWLPAQMPVELTALPEDEIAQLLEESVSMPPIDLGAKADVLAQMPVTIIVPMPRANWANAPLEIVQQSLTLTAAAPLGAAPTTPMALIEALLTQDRDPDLVDPTADAAWLALLAGAPTLWYMRRRQFLRTDALTGEAYAFARPSDGPATPGDTTTDTSTDTAAPALAEVSKAGAEATAASLRPLGLSEHYAAIRTAPTPDGHMARADLNALVSAFMAAGGALATADLVQRAAASGDLTRAGARRLARSYAVDALAEAFVPNEGFLTGGALDLIVPQFKGDGDAPRITTQFAQTANGGARPAAVPGLPMPAQARDMTKELLNALRMPPEVIDAIVLQGGGAIPLKDARDPGMRIEVLKRALEIGLPLIARQRDPGSIEAQTRRNLLVRSDTVPKLTLMFAEAGLARVSGALFDHMQAMERVFVGNATNAIRTIAETTNQILRG